MDFNDLLRQNSLSELSRTGLEFPHPACERRRIEWPPRLPIDAIPSH